MRNSKVLASNRPFEQNVQWTAKNYYLVYNEELTSDIRYMKNRLRFRPRTKSKSKSVPRPKPVTQVLSSPVMQAPYVET